MSSNTPTTQKAPKSSAYWIGLLILNAILFAAGDACNKYVTGLPMWEKVFLRSVIGLVFVAATFIKTRDKIVIGSWHLQLARAVVGFMVTFTTFYAAVNMPLGDFTTLKNTAPLFVLIFSAILLKEKLNKWAIIALLITLVGMVIITPPTFDSKMLPFLVAIAAAVFISLMEISGRAMRGQSNPGTVMLISQAFMAIVSLALFFITGSKWVTPPSTMILALLGIAILPTLSQTMGVYINFNVSLIQSTVFGNTGPIWAVLIGIMFFGEFPTVQLIAGVVLIIGGAILSALKNTPKSDKPAGEPAESPSESE